MMTKILVFIDQFQQGGAARVTSTMCNGLSQRGYDVNLACDNVQFSVFYPLNSRVKVITDALEDTHRRRNIFSPLFTLIRTIKSKRRIINDISPDIIIAVLPDIFFFTKLASIGKNIPIIACDHTSFDRKIKKKLTRFVRTHFYSTADALSILTKRDEKNLGNKFPKKQVIYNPLSFDILHEETTRRKNILCIGRLDVWDIKGFDIIISIWGNLANKFPEWILEIAGDGDEKSYAKIYSFIESTGLLGRVKLLGQIKDIKEYLSTTGIFALPSRVEGFPMVLMEALSQGCACVGFDCGGASSEMITKPKSGIVIPDGDLENFQRQLEILLQNEELRIEMSQNGRDEVVRFMPENFINQWTDLINKISKK